MDTTTNGVDRVAVGGELNGLAIFDSKNITGASSIKRRFLLSYTTLREPLVGGLRKSAHKENISTNFEAPR